MSSVAARVKGSLGVRKIGAIYVWIVLIAFFSLVNSTFYEYATFTQVLNQYAITGLVAMGLLLPLAAGLYDLSVGAVLGLSSMTAAWVLVNVTTNVFVAVLAGVAAALIVGVLNSVVLLVLRVDSFIGTLATSSIVTAAVVALSGDNVIAFEVFGDYGTWLGIHNIIGLTMPVGLLLIAILVIAYLLERTGYGRRLYAIGYEEEVARLSGIRVDRMRAGSLLASSALAGLAGTLAAAAVGAGDPTVGPEYLLPAFAAVFLGATQFRNGRFNPWGAAVAVLLLGTGNVGLILIGAPTWTPNIFSGALLILAVA
ncbi:MAG: ABC transporter permease, partial [Actinobacteria bacterium]|nr:ABC transporter permease [Actinomycetota bacterium]